MPEIIQKVIELTGNLCFLFCSTPRANPFIVLISSTIVALAASFDPAGLAIGDISRTLPAAVWRTLSSPSPGKTKMILISTEMVSGFE